jgi:perosamine synthetase
MTPIKPFFFDLGEDALQRFAGESVQILRSGVLILGEHTKRLERGFAEFVGARHAIAVNSGSTALEILLRLKRVEGREVLVPTNTNFATVAAVLRAGGRVRYLDMDAATFAPALAMVRDAVEEYQRAGRPLPAGVLWVHIGGVVSPEFGEVVSFCRRQGLFVLEDAAHAHGSAWGGVRAGNLADGAAFSFFPTKVMTTGEGGMIVTNDDEEDYLARSHRNQGKRGMDYGGLHHDFGNSSRITELGALLGQIQLEQLPEILRKRQRVSDGITAVLDRAGVGYVATRHMDAASQYKLIVRLPADRPLDKIKKALSEDGVIAGGGVYEMPCHQQPVFERLVAGGAFPQADHWCPRHVCPPLTSAMTAEDARFVGERLVRHLT